MINIRPSSELRNKYNEISDLCRETKEPIYLTVNGHGDTVIMNIDAFDQLISQLELLRLLAESENDVRNNRLAPISETISGLKKKLENL